MMEILMVLPSYSRAVAHHAYRGSRTSLLQLYKLSSLSPLNTGLSNDSNARHLVLERWPHSFFKEFRTLEILISFQVTPAVEYLKPQASMHTAQAPRAVSCPHVVHARALFLFI